MSRTPRSVKTGYRSQQQCGSSSNILKTEEIQPVEVYCRIKPFVPTEDDKSCIVNLDNKFIECTAAMNRSGTSRQTRYNFTGVFDENTNQANIFYEVALPLLDEFLHGKNTLLFTYGVTGSGKTYTMQGSPQQPGLVPRTIDVLFNSIGHMQTKKFVIKPDNYNGFKIQSDVDAMMERQKVELANRQAAQNKTLSKGDVRVDYLVREKTTISNFDDDFVYTVFMSLVEVYNNSVYDLLQDLPDPYNGGNKLPPNLSLREEGRKVYVQGALEIEVKSSDEALKHYLAGQRRRRVAETLLNAESSRSHCVLNLRLVRAPLHATIDSGHTTSDKLVSKNQSQNKIIEEELSSKGFIQVSQSDSLSVHSKQYQHDTATTSCCSSSHVHHQNDCHFHEQENNCCETGSLLEQPPSPSLLTNDILTQAIQNVMSNVIGNVFNEAGEKIHLPTTAADETGAPSFITAQSSAASSQYSTSSVSIPELVFENPIRIMTTDSSELIISQFSLVDLAGSERTVRTNNKGSRLKEASNINNSLMSLRMCIEILRENQLSGLSKVVPYRDQRLTYLFRNYFEGDGHVRILTCINQTCKELEETLQVLKFAESSQEIQTFKTPLVSRTATPNSNRSGDRILRECGNTTPLKTKLSDGIKTSCPAKGIVASSYELWDEVIPEPLLCSEFHLPTAGHVLTTEDNCNLLLKRRNFFQQRIDMKEKSFKGITKQYEALRGQIQSLCQYSQHFSSLSENRISEVLEKEKKRNILLQTKIKQMDKLLDEKNVALRQEEADRRRQIDRLRYQMEQLRRQKPQNDVVSKLAEQDSHYHHHQGSQERLNDQSKPPRTPTPANPRSKKPVASMVRQWENRVQTTTQTPNGSARVVANPRFTPGTKRRSRSAESSCHLELLTPNKVVWIEHHDSKATPSGTISSPKLKHRKSVTQIEFKDTLKATNYVLTHQKTDSDGNLETELYKGNLIPTAGGGTACIFNDVEKITQRSPLADDKEAVALGHNSRKRNSSTTNDCNADLWDLQSSVLKFIDEDENGSPLPSDVVKQRCRSSAQSNHNLSCVDCLNTIMCHDSDPEDGGNE